tara:strand:+ start:4942 stop:5844 length:903 start_codon:yes stop_codon:yes gene_type:complete
MSIYNDKTFIDLNRIARIGHETYTSFFDLELINKLNETIDSIYLSERILSSIGLGNSSYRNGSIFIGNLLIKSKIFIQTAFLIQNLLRENQISNYYLSEYFCVSTNKCNYFQPWWHRDFPHTIENFSIYNEHTLGFFIPVSSYNLESGSTKIVKNSNTDKFLNEKKGIITDMSANKGDLIIYDPKICHTGGCNLQNKTRHLIVAIFSRKELISYENFNIQVDMAFSHTDRNLLKQINLIRHKEVTNFFGRNRSIQYSVLSPIGTIFKKIIKFKQKAYSFIYFFWTRFIYLLAKNIIKLKL